LPNSATCRSARIVLNLFGFQLNHIAVTVECAVRVNAAQVFQIDAAAVDAGSNAAAISEYPWR
jgi:TRAP-type uncharacterized transport system substrate-binding protein